MTGEDIKNDEEYPGQYVSNAMIGIHNAVAQIPGHIAHMEVRDGRIDLMVSVKPYLAHTKLLQNMAEVDQMTMEFEK